MNLLDQQYSGNVSHCCEVAPAVGIPLRFISLSCAVILPRTSGFD